MEWKDITEYTTKQKLFGPRAPKTMTCKVMSIEMFIKLRPWICDSGWILTVYGGKVFKFENYPLKTCDIQEAQVKALKVVKTVLNYRKEFIENALDELEYLEGKDKTK